MNEEDPASRPPERYSAPDPEMGGAPEISRRVGAILDAVEREAGTLREQARQEAAQYLDHARHRADRLVEERQRRIAELSDDLLSKADAVVARLDDAAPVRQGFENLVRALGDAAERLARETEFSASEFEPQPFHHMPPGPPPASYPEPTAAQAPPAYAPPPPFPSAQPQPTYEPAQQNYDPPPGASSRPPASYPAQPPPAKAPGSEATERHATPPPAPSPGPGGGVGSADWRELDEARMIAIQMAASGATRATVRKHLQQALGVAQTSDVLDEIYGVNATEDARVPWTARPG